MQSFGRFIGRSHQTSDLRVEASSVSGLSLRQGGIQTEFDRLSRAVTRHGKVVTRFGAIRQVVVQEQPGRDGHPSVWSVNLELAGSQTVPVGECSDQATAQTTAAQIGAVTGAVSKIASD
jgi:hypothetical protein